MRRALGNVVLAGVGVCIVVSLVPWVWREMKR